MLAHWEGNFPGSGVSLFGAHPPLKPFILQCSLRQRAKKVFSGRQRFLKLFLNGGAGPRLIARNRLRIEFTNRLGKEGVNVWGENRGTIQESA